VRIGKNASAIGSMARQDRAGLVPLRRIEFGKLNPNRLTVAGRQATIVHLFK
jgi:hypothetical protein